MVIAKAAFSSPHRQCVKLTPGSHEQALATPSPSAQLDGEPSRHDAGPFTCRHAPWGDGRTAREEPEFPALWGDHTRRGTLMLLLGRGGINFCLL